MQTEHINKTDMCTHVHMYTCTNITARRPNVVPLPIRSILHNA